MILSREVSASDTPAGRHTASHLTSMLITSELLAGHVVVHNGSSKTSGAQEELLAGGMSFSPTRIRK